MDNWVSQRKALPDPAKDVLCFDGKHFFVGYFEWQQDPYLPIWNGSWTDDFNNAPVKYWKDIEPPPAVAQDIAASINEIKKVLGGAMAGWISASESLPAEWEEVLVWGKIISDNKGDIFKAAIADYRMDLGDDDKEVPYWSMAGGDGWHMEVTHWQPLPEGPSDVVASIDEIKTVLGNQSPDQVGADIAGEVTDYDLRLPFDRQSKGGQHPEFLMKDGPKESLDK